MNFPANKVNTWTQETLFPPEVVEIRISIGIVRDAEHCQFLTEVVDPVQGKLLAMVSRPHVPLMKSSDVWIEVAREVSKLVGEHTGPF